MSSTYREELEKFLKTLDVKAKTVIDIGGSQMGLKPRVKSWDVKEYLVFDLEKPHTEAQQPDVICDLNNEYSFVDLEYSGKADLIFCLEVFEYVWNPVNAFRVIAELLKKGGTAYVSFPFMYPTHNPIEDDCLRYTEFGIKKLAKHAGLKVSSITPRRPQHELLGSFFTAERMKAAKGYDHRVTGWIVKFKK